MSRLTDFDDRIVLFYHPFNYNSQKTILTMCEKNISFIPYALDLSNGEQYSDWFLKINKKADVPVLKIGSLILTGTRYIFNYLETNFKGYHSLLPEDANALEEMESLEKCFAQIQIGAITMGSFIHTDLRLSPKYPFIGPARIEVLKNNENDYEMLKKLQDGENVELMHKAKMMERRIGRANSRPEFQRLLDSAQNVLECINDKLAANPEREWLVGSKVVVADISLSLIMHRFNQLGFENLIWTCGKLPHLEKYFIKFKERDSFKHLTKNFCNLSKFMQNL